MLVKTPDESIGRYFGGHYGKAILAIFHLYAAPLSRGLKELSVRVSAIKRPWTSRLSILIRMKW